MTVMLGDPVGMRPADDRYWNGYIGEYVLACGDTVWVTWLPTSQTHTHVIVWNAEETWTIKNICRLQAARETEKLLVEIETS